MILLTGFNTFSQDKRIIKKHEIRDGISPKSVVSSGTGLFAAQNMMYRHTITIYDANGNRQAKIRDAVNLKEFGYKEYESSSYLGGPVEAAFTDDGKFLWVSNYSMVGDGFEHPGCDACHGSEFDPGFLYKINTETDEIENVVKVGAVPKFLAISDDQRKLLVSNWSSGDVSIIDLETEELAANVYVGPHPRGIDITEDSKTAFVTVMGSTKIAEVDLESFEVDYIKDVGRSPRSLILAGHDSLMYVSLNSGGGVLRYNRFTGEKDLCRTAAGPRSMCMSPDEDYLYVVNYFDNSFSKIDATRMEVAEQVKTADKPIGICGNWDESEIWVACYSGRIEIFKDFHLDSLHHGSSMLGFDMSDFWAFTHFKGSTEVEEDSFVSEVELDTIEEFVEPIEVEEIVEARSYPKQPLVRIKKDRFPKKDISEEESQVLEHGATVNSACQYYVIAGSFSVEENAQKRLNELEKSGYACMIIPGKLHYVSAGCYGTRPNADEAVNEVKNRTGYSAWVLKR